MSEYIERKALYKALTTAAVNDKFKSIGTWAKAICVLHDLHAADVEKMSDGYHTFADLYEQRLILSAALAKNNPNAWKSKRHEDGSEEDVVETVPVVRCENCLYWVSGKNECEIWEWCKMLNTDMPPNGFCYLGERKDDDDVKAD